VRAPRGRRCAPRHRSAIVLTIQINHRFHTPETFAVYNGFVPGVAAVFMKQVVLFVGPYFQARAAIVTLHIKVNAGFIDIFFRFPFTTAKQFF
jgi:hypothetical protein